MYIGKLYRIFLLLPLNVRAYRTGVRTSIILIIKLKLDGRGLGVKSAAIWHNHKSVHVRRPRIIDKLKHQLCHRQTETSMKCHRGFQMLTTTASSFDMSIKLWLELLKFRVGALASLIYRACTRRRRSLVDRGGLG